MADSGSSTPGYDPHAAPRGLPLVHLLLVILAIAVLYAPVVHLREPGATRSIMDIAGVWGQATLMMLIVLGVVCIALSALNRVTWSRLLLADLSVILCLIPAVVGLVVRWDTPTGGISGLAWGFWLAVALLALRMPLTLWIRGRAANLPLTSHNDRTGS